MRLLFNKPNEGTLICSTSGSTKEKFKFPIESIYDWYPLDRNYHYLYNFKENRLYITIMDSKVKYPSYDIDYRAGRVDEEYVSFTPDLWYNENVKSDNEKVFDFADSLGIVTPYVEHTETGIQKGFDKLDELGESVRVQLEARAFDDGLMLTEYRRLTEESQDIEIFKYITKEEEHFYYKLGLVYNMLVVMKKVKVAQSKLEV